MGRISQFFAYLHSILVQVPQHGYHNISRVVQPQIRSLSESFTASSNRISKDIELQPMKPNRDAAAKQTENPKARG
ncbi:hypothetical protein PV05_09420 [Exophiala xenobiotica]|uniref:Uncharacterized protein n=1 Tax=Exophiala xenobiotica TaxID=348802 RepID=A0A0D2ES33_9EURO|nr:uncharacterized protein PV05_09420 [Exophiala xenobiotica]KIW50629.1 hypothetical protein PV05_09420 [Exophiala xenobiotica]